MSSAALPHAPVPVDTSHASHPPVSLARFGMMTFLASEAMLFAGLIGAYIVLRISMGHGYRPEDAPILPWKMTGINTIILVSSSFTCIWAERKVLRGQNPALGLLITATLGLIFVVLQGFEWSNLYHEHMWFDQAGEKHGPSVYSANFFTLTGFHGLHVSIGVLMLFIAFFISLSGRFTPHNHTYLEIVALYWHFVDVVWIFLFTVLYLV